VFAANVPAEDIADMLEFEGTTKPGFLIFLSANLEPRHGYTPREIHSTQ
jgi:hypothetical protein